jgi:ABC-type uncharacterized transport system auxiliary subunit
VSSSVGATLLAAVLALAAGCGGAIPRTHYYILDLPAAAARPQPDPAPYSVAIMPVRAPEQLEQDRIVYRPSSVELDFYEYHRWAQHPADTVTAALVDRLRSRSIFASVALFDGKAKADYMLRSRLEKLEEVDSPEAVSVRVQLAADLLDTKTNRTVWNGAASHRGQVTTGEVAAVVEEMSRGVNDCLDQLISSLEKFAKSLPGAPAPASAASR